VVVVVELGDDVQLTSDAVVSAADAKQMTAYVTGSI